MTIFGARYWIALPIRYSEKSAVSVSPAQGTKPRIGSRPTRTLRMGMRMKSSRIRARRSRLSTSVPSLRLAVGLEEPYGSIIEFGSAISSPSDTTTPVQYRARKQAVVCEGARLLTRAPLYLPSKWPCGGLPDLHEDPPQRADL